MPRFYDPTRSDASVKLINWMSEREPALPQHKIEEYITRFRASGYFKAKFPIVVTNNCGFGHYFLDEENAVSITVRL